MDHTDQVYSRRAPTPGVAREQDPGNRISGETRRSRLCEGGCDTRSPQLQQLEGDRAARSGNEDHEFNGKFEMTWKFDLGKVAGWKFWSSEMKAEVRWGGPVLPGVGGINPVNTATFTPGLNGEVVAVTALNFTRLIPKDLKKGDLFAISFGRFNMLDLIDEDFFGGGGTEQNIKAIRALHELKEEKVLAAAAGAGAAGNAKK